MIVFLFSIFLISPNFRFFFPILHAYFIIGSVELHFAVDKIIDLGIQSLSPINSLIDSPVFLYYSFFVVFRISDI